MLFLGDGMNIFHLSSKKEESSNKFYIAHSPFKDQEEFGAGVQA